MSVVAVQQAPHVESDSVNARQWGARHRAGRNSACERCVRQKSKCVYRDPSGACERCTSSHKECVAPPGRQILPNNGSDSASRDGSVEDTTEQSRKRSSGPEMSFANSKKPRYEELEERINHLYNLWEKAASKTSSPQDPTVFPLTPLTGSVGSPVQEAWKTALAPSQRSQQMPFPEAIKELPTASDPEGFGYELLRRILPNAWRRLPPHQIALFGPINLADAETALLKFHEMVTWFPFVVVDSKWTFQRLSKERPFLALAIYIAASQQTVTDRHEFFNVFKDAFSQRCVVRGERGLDFLQGLMVVLAWCHQYMCRAAPMMAFWVNMMVGLFSDMHKLVIIQNRHPVTMKPMTHQHLLKAEIERAHLGCYIISLALVKNGQGLPISLTLTDEMLQKAWEFGERQYVETDAAIPYIVEMYKIAEDARDTLPSFDNPNAADHPSTFVLRRKLQQRLAQASQGVAQLKTGRKSVELTILMVQICISEPVALSVASRPIESNESPEPTPYQLRLLDDYCNWSLRFVYEASELHVSEFRLFPMALWIQVVSSLIQLTRVVAPDSVFRGRSPSINDLRQKVEAVLASVKQRWRSTYLENVDYELDQAAHWFVGLVDALVWFMHNGSQKNLAGKPLVDVARRLHEESWARNNNGQELHMCDVTVEPEIDVRDREEVAEPSKTGGDDGFDDVFANLSWDDLLGNFNVFQSF